MWRVDKERLVGSENCGVVRVFVACQNNLLPLRGPSRNDVGQTKAVNKDIVSGDVRGRSKTFLPGERDIFIDIVTTNENERVFVADQRRQRAGRQNGQDQRGDGRCCHQRDRRLRSAISGYADAADQLPILIERNAAGRSIKRRADHRHDR